MHVEFRFLDSKDEIALLSVGCGCDLCRVAPQNREYDPTSQPMALILKGISEAIIHIESRCAEKDFQGWRFEFDLQVAPNEEIAQQRIHLFVGFGNQWNALMATRAVHLFCDFAKHVFNLGSFFLRNGVQNREQEFSEWAALRALGLLGNVPNCRNKHKKWQDSFQNVGVPLGVINPCTLCRDFVGMSGEKLGGFLLPIT